MSVGTTSDVGYSVQPNSQEKIARSIHSGFVRYRQTAASCFVSRRGMRQGSHLLQACSKERRNKRRNPWSSRVGRAVYSRLPPVRRLPSMFVQRDNHWYFMPKVSKFTTLPDKTFFLARTHACQCRRIHIVYSVVGGLQWITTGPILLALASHSLTKKKSDCPNHGTRITCSLSETLTMMPAWKWLLKWFES